MVLNKIFLWCCYGLEQNLTTYLYGFGQNLKKYLYGFEQNLKKYLCGFGQNLKKCFYGFFIELWHNSNALLQLLMPSHIHLTLSNQFMLSSSYLILSFFLFSFSFTLFWTMPPHIHLICSNQFINSFYLPLSYLYQILSLFFQKSCRPDSLKFFVYFYWKCRTSENETWKLE